MAQYRVGTVSVTSGSPYVSGAGTLFDSEGIAVGSLFNLEGNSGWYYVASVPSNTGLVLTANYAGTTQYNQNYVIVRDYLTPQNIPLMHRGDINWTSIFNEAMLRIKVSLDGISSPSGSGLGLDGAYNAENAIVVDADPVIFYRSGYYGSSQNANAFRIIDQTTSGPAGMPPIDGALQYIYSKHRIPLIAVTNEADRSLPDSPSTTPHAAIIGLAMSDDHDNFTSLTNLTNVGMAAYSIDYHSTYAVGQYSNVGLLAYSQRGYGLSAYSGSSYSIYSNQTVSPYGIYSEAARPLIVSNQNFGGATNSFAIQVLARRAGVSIQSTESGVAGSPLLKINTAGRALESIGASVLTHTGTALYVSGGSISLPVVDINAPNGIGMSVYSGASYGISASSSGRPSIKAVNGIVTYAADKDNILSPEAGTVVYSGADADLMLHNGSEWVRVADVVSASVPTMQQIYESGRTIAVTAGSVVPLAVSSTDELSLSVQNTNVGENKNAIDAYSARGWGISVSSDAVNSTYGGINVSSGYGLCIKATSRGPFASYTTTGVAGGYGLVLNTGTGGGIQVISSNEDVTTRGSLYMQTTSATGITMVSTTGKLIDYRATTGTLAGDGYAITASCGTGGGAYIYGTGGTRANLRLANTNTLSTLLEIEAGGGTGINISNAQRAITASCQGDYAILARSSDYPSIKSYNGIVAYSTSYTAITNPEPGTITFSWWDRMLYYYVDDLNGWFPVAIPSGYVAPSGSPSCMCIDGVIVYTSNKDLISPAAMAEGQLVFDHATQLVYVADENLEWSLVGGGASGSCTCPDGVNIYHLDKEDIITPSEGTLLYEGQTQNVYYWNGADWLEVGEGSGGVIRYSRGYNNSYPSIASVMNDVASFIVPYNGILTGVKFAVDNAPGIGGLSFDIRKKTVEGTAGTSVLGGTLITIDAGEYESLPRALSENVNQYDSIVFDIVSIGGGGAPGGNDIRVVYYIESDFSGAKGVTMLVTGTITAGSAIANVASFIVPYDGVITTVKAAVDTAPIGGNLTLDINKKLAGGSSWNSILTSPVTIIATEYESSVVTVNASVSQYDHINLDIDSSGSTVAGGADLRVLISLTESEVDSYIVVNVSSNYTVRSSDRLVSINSSSGDIVITMPAPADVTGIPFILKKNSGDTNTITINGTDIDGSSSTIIMGPWQSITLVSNGSRYNRI